MVSLPLDLSYLGVFTLWTNELGMPLRQAHLTGSNVY